MILALLLSCAPRPSGASIDACDEAELAAGELRVCRLGSGDAPDGSGGRGSDWRLQNALLDVIVRDDYAPMTRLEGAGGTVIGAVVPGADDVVLELIPSLAGGWFSDVAIDGFQEEDTVGLRLEGSDASGQPATLEYRLRADQPTLELVGAEGFTVVPEVGAVRVGESLELDDVVITADGPVEDAGGELRWLSGQQVHIGSRRSAYLARWSDGVAVAGTAEGAEWVEARDDSGRLARLPVDDGTFSGELPPETVEVVAVATGHADSAGLGPGEGLELLLGEEGWLQVQVVDEAGQSIAALVEREGETWVVPPEGRSLPVGPGTAETLVWAGPGHEAVDLGSLQVDADTRLDLVLPRVLAADSAPVLAELGLLGWPDATVREEAAPRLARAVGRGVRYAVVVAQDEVAQDLSQDAWTRPTLVVRGGSQAATSTAGQPLAWPWYANSQLWGHGAAQWPVLDPWQLLSAMDLIGSRNVILDLDWMDAAGASPDGVVEALAVRLDGIDQLDAYLALLDRGEKLPPVGPWTWVEGVDEALFSTAEVEHSLWEGRTVATNGPSISLRVQDVGPGQRAWLGPSQDALGPPPDRASESGSPQGGEPLDQLSVQLRVATPGWAPLDEVAIYGPDGQELARFAARQDGGLAVAEDLVLPPVEWILAAAWGDQSSPLTGEAAWAITSPVWVQLP